MSRGIKKMLYVRSVNAIADDDGPADSLMIPVEDIRGYAGAAADAFAIITWISPYQYAQTDAGNCGSVLLTVGAGSSDHRQLANDLALEIANGHSPIIVLGDDVTGEYFSVITGILAINNDVTDD